MARCTGEPPHVVEKALASDAPAVIADLEDAVAESAKPAVRRGAAEPSGRSAAEAGVRAGQRPCDPWWEADVDALAETKIAGIVVPKVDDPAVLDDPSIPEAWALRCRLETALGVEPAFAIASHPGVEGISIGEADLADAEGLRASCAHGRALGRAAIHPSQLP